MGNEAVMADALIHLGQVPKDACVSPSIAGGRLGADSLAPDLAQRPTAPGGCEPPALVPTLPTVRIGPPRPHADAIERRESSDGAEAAVGLGNEGDDHLADLRGE